MRLIIILGLYFPALISCYSQEKVTTPEVYMKVLGVAQDAGFPQIGCEKECCIPLWRPATPGQFIVSLGLIDTRSQKKWLFEATPDIKRQLALLNEDIPTEDMMPAGIFLTHAHMGHYSGLIQLGREAISADSIPVYTMTRMADFLGKNAPWSQLIELKNIVLDTLHTQVKKKLADDITVTPFPVPHRDEFSETVGFLVNGPNRRVAFIPDIDKWSRWDTKLSLIVQSVDVAYLDGTFFEADELPGRDMSEIPHPFIVETMEHLKDLTPEEKAKIHFIHFNHTNPVMHDPEAIKKIEALGFNVARQGDVVRL